MTDKNPWILFKICTVYLRLTVSARGPSAAPSRISFQFCAFSPIGKQGEHNIQHYFLCGFFTPDGSEPFWDKSGTDLNETKVLNFFLYKKHKTLTFITFIYAFGHKKPKQRIFWANKCKKAQICNTTRKAF